MGRAVLRRVDSEGHEAPVEKALSHRRFDRNQAIVTPAIPRTCDFCIARNKCERRRLPEGLTVWPHSPSLRGPNGRQEQTVVEHSECGFRSFWQFSARGERTRVGLRSLICFHGTREDSAGCIGFAQEAVRMAHIYQFTPWTAPRVGWSRQSQLCSVPHLGTADGLVMICSMSCWTCSMDLRRSRSTTARSRPGDAPAEDRINRQGPVCLT